jgi:CRISPR-associated protein Csd1
MLHLLRDYAEQSGRAATEGFKEESVRWLLRFDLAGNYLGATQLGDNKGKGEIFRVPRLSQPEIKAGGKGTRHFLCDSVGIVLGACGRTKALDDKTLSEFKRRRQDIRTKHAFFSAKLREAGVESGMTVLRSIADALDDWRVLRQIRNDLARRDVGPKPTENVTFWVDGHDPPLLIKSDRWRGWYSQFLARLVKNTSERQMISFASGKAVTPAKTHPKIKGLAGVGGIAMGDALASFKQDAFRHFGLRQSENAAVGKDEAVGLCDALDSLIRDRSRNLANSKVIYWYAGPAAEALHSHPEDDPMAFSLLPMASPTEDDEQDGQVDLATPPSPAAELSRRAEAQGRARLAKLLDAVRSGQRPDLVKTKFNALCLSANSGRVVVRDLIQGDFTDVAVSVNRWMDDLSVVYLDSPIVPDNVPKLEFIVTCVLSPRPKGQQYADWVEPAGRLREPLLREAIGYGTHDVLGEAARMLLPRYRTAIRNAQFDEALDRQGLHRNLLYARVSLLKAFLIRQGVPMEPCLFEDHPAPAYHFGRLLAVLAHVQKAALGDVGAGVVQRYYARASTAPADALGPLISLSNRHLDKIPNRRWASHLQSRIAQIWGKVSSEYPPRSLDSVGQSLFAMGFYQQIAQMKHEMAKRAKKGHQGQQTGSAGSRSQVPGANAGSPVGSHEKGE